MSLLRRTLVALSGLSSFCVALCCFSNLSCYSSPSDEIALVTDTIFKPFAHLDDSKLANITSTVYRFNQQRTPSVLTVEVQENEGKVVSVRVGTGEHTPTLPQYRWMSYDEIVKGITLLTTQLSAHDDFSHLRNITLNLSAFSEASINLNRQYEQQLIGSYNSEVLRNVLFNSMLLNDLSALLAQHGLDITDHELGHLLKEDMSRDKYISTYHYTGQANALPTTFALDTYLSLRIAKAQHDPWAGTDIRPRALSWYKNAANIETLTTNVPGLTLKREGVYRPFTRFCPIARRGIVHEVYRYCQDNVALGVTLTIQSDENGMAKSITLNEDATKHAKGPVLTFTQRMAGMQCLMGMLKQQRDLSQLNSININPLALADETIAMCKAYGKMKEGQLVDTERLDLIMQRSRLLPALQTLLPGEKLEIENGKLESPVQVLSRDEYARRYGFNGNTLSLPTLMCGYELVWVYFGE